MTIWATRRPPRQRGTRAQHRALRRAAERYDLSDCERATLGVLIDHADGAGFAYLLVDTIIREGGCKRRSVFRALADLEAAELIARYRHRSPRQGATTYRLGRALRDAAGLAEVDVHEALGLTSGTPRGTPRSESSNTPEQEVPLAPLLGTPQKAAIPLHNEGCHDPALGTPKNVGTKNTSSDEQRLSSSTSEVDLASAREADDLGATDRLLDALRAGADDPPSPSPSSLHEAPGASGVVDPPADPSRAVSRVHATSESTSSDAEPTLDQAMRDPDLFAVHVEPFIARCPICDRRPGLHEALFHGASIVVCDECRRTYPPIERAVREAAA